MLEKEREPHRDLTVMEIKSFATVREPQRDLTLMEMNSGESCYRERKGRFF